ncbi:MAG: transporter ATP-binding protein [Hyphomicrobiales bacterium]|nr:transporter ATP-binding protein [Hyphomicrobiales bacterium]
MAAPAIRIDHLSVRLGGREVIRDLSLTVDSGEIVGLIGASGSGKTVLLRTMLGLVPMSGGSVDILGARLRDATQDDVRLMGCRVGMLFQHGALFSSLSVRENVEFPMREYLEGSDRMFREIALAKLQMVGIAPADADKLPSELSGGMTKRVALARALALDPELVFLDEPTSGLDPIASRDFDALIKTLHGTLGLTVFMITHDLHTLRAICGRVAALYEGTIVADGSYESVSRSQHLWLRDYFRGERAVEAEGWR